MNQKTTGFSIVLTLLAISSYADVVINEIHYNPVDAEFEVGSLREFIELYNPGPDAIDLSGYQFTNGLTYTFPDGSMLDAGSYLVVAKNPAHSIWNNFTSQLFGPYEGRLDDGGERVRLEQPDGAVVEDFKYSDDPPWPRAADGYGPSLERVRWDLPASDYHSWRASHQNEGTPGAENSVAGVLPQPMIVSHQTFPSYPTSKDAVAVQLHIDAADQIAAATLQWEVAAPYVEGEEPSDSRTLVRYSGSFRYFKGTQGPSPGLEWTQPDFDDSEWLTGNGGFGYGEAENIGTYLFDMQRTYSTVYLRRTFQVNFLDELASLQLLAYYSGGFVCYINGVEVARDNFSGEIHFDSSASSINRSDEPTLVTIGNVSDFMVEGENTFAVVGLTRRISLSTFLIAAQLREGERSGDSIYKDQNIAMDLINSAGGIGVFEATVPPNPSQSLVRFNIQLALADGASVVLPYVTTLRPYESYFVYDGEIDSKLPILWPYRTANTRLTEEQRSVSGVVFLATDANVSEVFDGALAYTSRNGTKLRFLKGEEYREDRTLNLLPEQPLNDTTSGIVSPHLEYMGYWYFRQMGVLTPRAEWYRVIQGDVQTQQVVVQQVNERFLESNGFDPDGDLLKRNYVYPLWEPHTNKEDAVMNITLLEGAIRQRDPDNLRAAIEENLVEEEFLAYSVASVLISNWDGFHNNHWMYHDPEADKWQIVPWDLDKTWGYLGVNFNQYMMPLNYPLDGQGIWIVRDPGPITGWIHKDEAFHEAYINRLRYELTHSFTEEVLSAKIETIHDLLLEDLGLLEQAIGYQRFDRRFQIEDATQDLLEFVELRRINLIAEIGTPVQDWALY